MSDDEAHRLAAAQRAFRDDAESEEPDFEEPSFEEMARAEFDQTFVELMTAIGWVASREICTAWDIGNRSFDDACEWFQKLPDAKKEVWRALLAGEIEANGATPGGVVVISALEWRFLEFGAERNRVVSRHDSARAFSRVAVETAKLFELWPAAAADAACAPSRGQGRRPEQRARVMQKMRLAVAGGYDLTGATQEELATMFNASRSVVRPAREAVLSEINSGQLETKNN